MIEFINFVRDPKDSRIGFASVRIKKWGAIIESIAIHTKDGRFWVNLPTKFQEKDGKKMFIPVISLENPDHQKEFLKQIRDCIIKEIKEAVPETQQELDQMMIW